MPGENPAVVGSTVLKPLLRHSAGGDTGVCADAVEVVVHPWHLDPQTRGESTNTPI